MQRYYPALCQSEKDMRKWLAILVLLTGLLACNKEKFEKQIEGNYTGTFQRTSPAGFYPQQQVSLNLNNNSFSGQSTMHGNLPFVMAVGKPAAVPLSL
jgi:hypothetical protein